jgi:hypothetical protein
MTTGGQQAAWRGAKKTKKTIRYTATVAAALVFLDFLKIQGQSSLLVGKCKKVFLDTPILLFSNFNSSTGHMGKYADRC